MLLLLCFGCGLPSRLANKFLVKISPYDASYDEYVVVVVAAYGCHFSVNFYPRHYITKVEVKKVWHLAKLNKNLWVGMPFGQPVQM